MEGALETIESLYLYVSVQVKSDIVSSLNQVFAYLSLIGSPMTLAKKIGKGVKAFFYEPYIGKFYYLSVCIISTYLSGPSFFI